MKNEKDQLFETAYPLFLKSIPETLFHYTNCQSIISILTAHELWLSNILYMNDKLELNHSINVIKKSIQSLNTSISLKNSLQSEFSKLKKKESSKLFILSLSPDNDSLNLWNNYSKNEGYNIGFSKELLLSSDLEVIGKDGSKTKSRRLFGRVLYDEDKQIEFCTKVLKEMMEKIDTSLDNKSDVNEIAKLVNPYLRIINGYTSLFKTKKHNIENEIRLIVELPNQSQYINFRSRNGIVLPYIRISTGNKLPINELTIGPKINDALALEGVKNLLSHSGYKIKVSNSETELRF